MIQNRNSSKEQCRLRSSVERTHNASMQNAHAKESCRQKGTDWHTCDKDTQTKVAFQKIKTPKRLIGLNKQHRKAFGLLDTQGCLGSSAIPSLCKTAARNELCCSSLTNTTFKVPRMHLCWEGWVCLLQDPTSNRCNPLPQLLWKTSPLLWESWSSTHRKS